MWHEDTTCYPHEYMVSSDFGQKIKPLRGVHGKIFAEKTEVIFTTF